MILSGSKKESFNFLFRLKKRVKRGSKKGVNLNSFSI
jgi:hypothetical protein